MCVGTSVAIAIAAGATAGGSIAAAKIGSNASKKAGELQATAADKALAVQREQYQQQRADFAPYQQAGAGAAARLADMSAVPPPTFQPGGPPAQLGMPAGRGNLGPRFPPQGPMMPPPDGMMQPAVQPRRAGPLEAIPGAAPQIGGPAAGGALWTVQAPDGATAQYPPEVAQQYIARGATRVA